MIGTKNISVSLTLNIVSIVISIVLFVALFYRKKQTSNNTMIGASTIMIVFGNFLEIIGMQQTIIYHQFSVASAFVVASAYLMYCVALVLMIMLIVSDEKQHIVNGEKKKNFIKIVMLLVPIIINLGVHIVNENVFVLGIGMVISLQIGYLQSMAFKEEKMAMREKTIREKENRMLMEQIHPHFIFNSLMAIEELCYKDSELAAQSIENFAGYLRSNIEVLTTNELISFEKELRNINQYISLEKAASSKEFQVEYNMEETDFLIPALSIQPLVENSIRHGIAHKKSQGKVVISTKRKGDFVIITVFDNGKFETETNGKKKGIGLDNVRERIEETHNGKLEIIKGEDGTKAVVTFPLM